MNPETVRRNLDTLVRERPDMGPVARLLGPVVVELVSTVEENRARLDQLEKELSNGGH